MRVLAVVPGNIVHETAQFLGLHAAGVDLAVVTTRRIEPDAGRLEAAGVPVHEVPLRARIDRAGVRALRARILEHRAQIVHAFNNRTVSNALAATRGLPVKFVAYRGIAGNVSVYNPASWLTYLHPRVDRIVCVAEAVRESLLAVRGPFGWRIPPAKLVTVYKGHDPAWYTAPPADLGALGLPAGAFTVACVANYRPRKGVTVLLDALERLGPKRPVHVLLIGHMDHPRLRRKIARHPFRERIHVLGFRRDAVQIQAACSVCVLPALRREGLPKSIIEGMVYGVPPVVSDAGGSPELVEPGVSGLVVPAGDAQALAEALARLQDDPALRARMGAAARQRILEHFTVARTVEQTHALYRELLEAGGASR
ncbi:MAG: glycosyl transferase [Gammaproteobacteria bacterium]|nr:MAG: glycosyl transferase [Gammaproteobacteria bacterium]